MANNASFAEAASVAARSLRSSKLRSFLTLLGIILATTTLIAVMSVINGMDLYITQQVSDMGSEGFRIRRIVMIGEFNPKKYLEMEKRNPEMNREEYRFIKERATLLRDIGMEAFRQGKLTRESKTTDGVSIQGVTANMGAIANIQVVNGRFLSDNDDQRRMSVAVIGNDVREVYFAGIDPIGKTFNIDGHPFEVVGVAKPRGSVFGQSRDLFVTIPVETFFKKWGSRRGLGYNAEAISATRMNEAMDEVRSLLRAWRHLRPGQDDNFGIAASESLRSAWKQLTGAIAATAVGVVSVFMVVGGVVIMNIMLAVVTERTHEIGIRKAVGARQRDIMGQFLVESSMLSAAGGVIGVLIAWTVVLLVRALTPVPMSMPFTAVIISVSLSAVVGLFFGIYPARRAARLDPIEALRYE